MISRFLCNSSSQLSTVVHSLDMSSPHEWKIQSLIILFVHPLILILYDNNNKNCLQKTHFFIIFSKSIFPRDSPGSFFSNLCRSSPSRGFSQVPEKDWFKKAAMERAQKNLKIFFSQRRTVATGGRKSRGCELPLQVPNRSPTGVTGVRQVSQV